MKTIKKKFSDVREIFDPIKDFYSMRYKFKMEISFLTIIPIVVGGIFVIVDCLFHVNRNFVLDDFFNDLLNQFITMMTLFISFSMAYLSIIITSSSNNIDRLKNCASKYKLKRQKEACTLYQVIVCEITYGVVIEICFLLCTLLEKFIFYLVSNLIVKIFISIDIIFFIHILLILMVTVKDIYYSFWKSV